MAGKVSVAKVMYCSQVKVCIFWWEVLCSWTMGGKCAVLRGGVCGEVQSGVLMKRGIDVHNL